MQRYHHPEISTESLVMPSNCGFRIWSRAELVVDSVHVMLEGSHAGLMLELLRNRGRRVASPVLWAAMLGDGLCEAADDDVGEKVQTEIRRVRYMLSTRGILMAIDETAPHDGFMLSGLHRIDSRTVKPQPPVRHKRRRAEVPPVSAQTEKPQYRPAHRDGEPQASRPRPARATRKG